jgi:hypothetical protein
MVEFDVMSGICRMFCHSRPRCRCLIGFLLSGVCYAACLSHTNIAIVAWDALRAQGGAGVLWPKMWLQLVRGFHKA